MVRRAAFSLSGAALIVLAAAGAAWFLAYTPRVKAQLIDSGTTFENGFVTDPLCCPSRASILRGQYVHNHTIKGNAAPDAHDRFRDLGLENSTVAMWLHDGGYRTALIGKYILHRLTSGKTTACEEDIRVPYVVRGPEVPAGRTLDHMVLNNDLVPTFAELGGVSAPPFVDGRSLAQ